MGKMNWVRVLLCGVLTGAVWYILSLFIFVFALGGTDFGAAVEAARVDRTTLAVLPFVLNIVMGIWVMWLYAAIRPHLGPGPKTAAVAAFALWIIASLEASKFGALGFIPLKLLLVPVSVALPVVTVAVLAGAWLYKE